MSRFRRIAANTRGRDLAVGDIHGHFQRLQQCLDGVGFNPAVDRLFSVGDLVDRGPHSAQALDWLAQPWFHAVQGNHESLAINHLRGGRLDLDMYRAAGGGWFLDLPGISSGLLSMRSFKCLSPWKCRPMTDRSACCTPTALRTLGGFAREPTG
jgi:hypothetical protein